MEAAPATMVNSDDPEAPCICFIDALEHPFDIGEAASALACNVVVVPIDRWNDALTPWAAPGLYHSDGDFEGRAAETLAVLVGAMLPEAARDRGLAPRAWGIAGYSLAGLFSLYAFSESTFFQAAASMSGSVWYEGWTEHLACADVPGNGRFAFLSVGTGEKRARQQILKTVEDRTARTAEILESCGCEVEFQTSPGAHFAHVPERIATGLSAIDGFWERTR